MEAIAQHSRLRIGTFILTLVHVCFIYLALLWSRAKAFVAYVRKSSRATQELRNLQKQQVLKDTPEGDNPITNPEVDETEENEGEAEGGYSQSGQRLKRVLALRAPVDTRWNSLYFMIER